MYSAKDDVILDPFLGTGTTTAAAMTSGRNSIGVEIDESFQQIICPIVHHDIVEFSNGYLSRQVAKTPWRLSKTGSKTRERQNIQISTTAARW